MTYPYVLPFGIRPAPWPCNAFKFTAQCNTEIHKKNSNSRPLWTGILCISVAGLFLCTATVVRNHHTLWLLWQRQWFTQVLFCYKLVLCFCEFTCKERRHFLMTFILPVLFRFIWVTHWFVFTGCSINFCVITSFYWRFLPFSESPHFRPTAVRSRFTCPSVFTLSIAGMGARSTNYGGWVAGVHGLDKKWGTVFFDMVSKVCALAYELQLFKTRQFMQLFEFIISEIFI